LNGGSVRGGGIGGLSLAAALDRRGLVERSPARRRSGRGGPCLGVTRVRLQEIQLTGAAAVPHRLGVGVTDVTPDAGRVAVGFSDGTSGDYDLVVGADGIHSTVRRLAMRPVEPTYAGAMAWRSVVPAAPPA